MRSIQDTTVHMRVKFSDRNLARPVLEGLGRERALTVNVLRGRITEKDATFELEVTGNPRSVESFVRSGATWGAPVGTLVGRFVAPLGTPSSECVNQ